MPDTATCEHKHTDWAWSRGHLERCTDCGAVNETDGWTNPVQRFYDAVNGGNQGAAYHLGQYMKIAKEKHGIPYPVHLKK